MKKVRIYLLRIICLIIVFLISFNINYVFSNLEDDEEIDINELEKEVIETSKVIYNNLKLNSKIALIYDRLSRQGFI